MKSPANAFKIGIFILIGTVLLIAGILLFGARGMFQPRILCETAMHNSVDGLSRGSPVYLRGVRIGAVEDIQFAGELYPGTTNPGTVIVLFFINNESIPSDLAELVEYNPARLMDRGVRARIKTQGVTGTSTLEIAQLNALQNPPPVIDWIPRNPYFASTEGQFTAILDAIQRSLENIERINFDGLTRRLDSVLGSVDTLVTNVSKVDFHTIAAEVQDRLTGLNSTIQEANRVLGSADRTLNAMQLPTLSSNANILLLNLQGTGTKLDALVAKADRIEVSALNDTLLETRTAVRDLSATLQSLRTYPAGFIFGGPPPPVLPPAPATR